MPKRDSVCLAPVYPRARLLEGEISILLDGFIGPKALFLLELK